MYAINPKILHGEKTNAYISVDTKGRFRFNKLSVDALDIFPGKRLLFLFSGKLIFVCQDESGFTIKNTDRGYQFYDKKLAKLIYNFLTNQSNNFESHKLYVDPYPINVKNRKVCRIFLNQNDNLSYIKKELALLEQPETSFKEVFYWNGKQRTTDWLVNVAKTYARRSKSSKSESTRKDNLDKVNKMLALFKKELSKSEYETINSMLCQILK